MWIDASEVAQLKKAVDLRALIEQAGVELTKSGRKWLGACPFHKDEGQSFSLNPRIRTWTCSVCDDGAKGDVVTFIMKREGVGPDDALARLRELAGVEPAKEETPTAKEGAESRPGNLMMRVAELYRQRFKADPTARDFLRELGITSEETLQIFCAGYCDGSLVAEV